MYTVVVCGVRNNAARMCMKTGFLLGSCTQMTPQVVFMTGKLRDNFNT